MRKIAYLSIIFVIFGAFLSLPDLNLPGAKAASIDEIQKNIEEKSKQIEDLNKEIKQLDGQIQEVNKQGKTLQTTIKSLDTSATKISKEIQLTESKISSTNLTIEQLAIEIDKKALDIEKNKEAIAQSLRTIQRSDEISTVESILIYPNLATLWNDMAAIEQFQVGVQKNIKNLINLKSDLDQKKAESTSKKQILVGLHEELGDQKKVVDITKKEKAAVLAQTKNTEANYRKQLEEKKRLAEAFASELSQFEAALRIIVDPTSYPPAGKGILVWPLDNVFITQKFGNTSFSLAGAYNGQGHNGIDFRASMGTKVKAALSGTVTGIGNTDTVPGCYSYGQWVLIRHDNGLSTLYAHLNLIKVNQGERVSTGSTIGYSGNTGYSTGPHLHFGVYATQGVKIVKYETSKNCKNAVIPVADLRAYLDPLVYL